MRVLHSTLGRVAAGLAVLAVAVPIALTCVIPRTLSEQIGLAGDEILVGNVTGFQELVVAEPEGGSFTWTRVDFRAEDSLVSGRQSFDTSFYFKGGVTAGSQTTSVTPSSEDIKVGRKLMVFLGKRSFTEQTFGANALQLDSYAEVYRVFDGTVRGAQKAVVLGKGRGFAFTQNVELADAKVQVAQEVAKQKKGK